VGKPKWQLLWPLVAPETLQKYRNFSVQVHIGFKTLLNCIPFCRGNKLEERQAHTVSQQALPTQILLQNDLQAQQGILSILNHIPSLKLFLNRRGKSRRCHMRPVPVVFLRMAFTLQLSAQRQKKRENLSENHYIQKVLHNTINVTILSSCRQHTSINYKEVCPTQWTTRFCVTPTGDGWQPSTKIMGSIWFLRKDHGASRQMVLEMSTLTKSKHFLSQNTH
jgi:hypothetical protein